MTDPTVQQYRQMGKRSPVFNVVGEFEHSAIELIKWPISAIRCQIFYDYYALETKNLQ